MSLGIVLVLLLVVSLILMGVGIYRILRQHKLATPAFARRFRVSAR